MIFIIICIFIYYYTIFIKKQHLKIYKFTSNNFITSSYVKLSNTINIDKCVSILEKRITSIEKLTGIDFHIIPIYSVEQLLNEIYTRKKFMFRILIYNYSKTLLIFQNHRSLCNGQERINLIINSILDGCNSNDKVINYNDYLQKEKFSNILNSLKNGLSDIQHISFFFKKNIFFYNLLNTDINNTLKNMSKQFLLKTYTLKTIKKFCKNKGVTLNDFGITYCIFHLLYNPNFTKEYIVVFVPILFNNDYIYSILKIKNIKKTFIELLTEISYLCKYTIRNPLIKVHSSICLRLLEYYPYSIYSKLYNKTIDKVDIFISNVVGFSQPRTFLDVHVENIYQMYNCYNVKIEAGVSSYKDKFNITLNINGDYVNNFTNIFVNTL